ncbi:Serine/threonine-protein kinase [Trichinella pseudospiralis]
MISKVRPDSICQHLGRQPTLTRTFNIVFDQCQNPSLETRITENAIIVEVKKKQQLFSCAVYHLFLQCNVDNMTEADELSRLWNEIRTILYADDGDVKELVQACEHFKTVLESQTNSDAQISIPLIDVAFAFERFFDVSRFNEEFVHCIQSLLLPLTTKTEESEIELFFEHLVKRICELRFDCQQTVLLKIVSELLTTPRVISCFTCSIQALISLFKKQCVGSYYPSTLELFLEIFMRCFGVMLPRICLPEDFVESLLRVLLVMQPRADKKKQSDRLIRIGRKVLHLCFPEDFEKGTSILMSVIKVAQDDAKRFKNGLNSNERYKYSKRIWKSVSLFNSMVSIFSTEERQWNQHTQFLQFVNTVVPMLTSIAALMLRTSECRRSAIADFAIRSIIQLHELLLAGGDISVFLESIVELGLLLSDPKLTLLYCDVETILELIKQIIADKDRCLSAHHITTLIGPDGILPSLRFHQEASIVRLTTEIYRSLLLLKGDLCSIMSYRMTVGELVVNLEMLACRVEVEGLDQQPLKIEFDNIWNGRVEPTIQQSELKFILHFNASLLALVYRSEAFSWISVADVPDIYSILTSTSVLSSKWLAVFFPSVHYALLMLLRMYCTAYLHFSDEEMLCNLRKQSTLNFHDYVEMMKQLLMNDAISVPVRKILYEWTGCIFCLVMCDDDLKSAFNADLVELAWAAVTFHCDIIKCKEVFRHMLSEIFSPQFNYPKILRDKFYATILLASCYSCDKYLLKSLHFLLPDFSYDEPNQRAIMLEMANNAQLNSNGQQPASSHLFVTLMDFVLLNIDASELTLSDLKYFTDTAKSMIQYCSTKTEVEVLISEYPGSVWMLALSMLANCCIENRLKTIYGPKSSNILHLVEIALSSVIRVTPSSNRTQLADQLSAERLHSVQCSFLLYFVEILYKMMYRCYMNIDSLAHGLGSFYRINWNGFDAYFRKIRSSVVGLASRQGEYETILMWISRLSSSDPILDETPSWGIYSFLLNVVDAYVMLQAAPSVIGFSHWIENKLKIDDQLIKICSHKASEQYEITASMLTSWVMSVENGNGNSDVVDVLSVQIKYCYEEIVDCFVKLGDWSMAASWLNRGKNSCGVPVYKWQPLVDYIERMANLGANLERCETTADGDGGGDEQQLVRRRPTDYRNFLYYVDCTLLNIMANSELSTGSMKEKLNFLRKDLETRRFLHSTYVKPLSLCKDYEIRLDIIKVLQNASNCQNWILGPVDTSQLRIDQLTVMYSFFCMTDVLPCGREVCLSDFCTSFAKRARKTGNLNLCLRIWRRHFGCNSTTELCSFLVVLTNRFGQALACAIEVALLLRELGRGAGCEQRAGGALKFLTQTVAIAASANSITTSSDDGDGGANLTNDHITNILLAKALVVLANWLGDMQFSDRHLPPPSSDDAEIAFADLFQSKLQQLQTQFDLNDNIADGVALSLAVEFCPTSVKAHHHYIRWLNSIIFSLVEEKEGFHAFRLSSKEKQFITSLLSAKSKVNLDNVLLLLETVRSEQNQLTWNVICPDVRKVCTSSFALEKLHEWWEARHSHLFNLYNTLCESYFVILRNNCPDDFITVDATIQIIRLVTSHYTDLKDCLHDGFSNVDVGCWKPIIPQLFAHLGHRNAGVRTLFADVLCSMAVEFPAMVIYPALAGLSGDGKHYRPADFYAEDMDSKLNSSADVSFTESEEEEEEENDYRNELIESQFRQNCCKRILDCLSELHPQMVRDTTLFVAELKRIILLHEEVWYSLLTSMRPEVSRRLRIFYQNHEQHEKQEQQQQQQQQQHQEEQLPISDERKEQLKRGKTLLMKKMLFQILVDLHEVTSQPPQTKSEAAFAETFSPRIGKIVEQVEDENCIDLHKIWDQFCQLHADLAEQTQNKSWQLKMEEISPKLAEMHDTMIPVPGVFENDQPVMIKTVCAEVKILPTKTKPKKFSFVGSNGVKYRYLLKGAEDLHLDERVSQFLNFCNILFQSSKKSLGEAVYHARSYAVTPLGQRSGLIQWVDNFVPLFLLYRKWQLKQGSKNLSRPSEMFYEKLRTLLLNEGLQVKHMRNRSKCPLPILRKVLDRLIEETPRTILSDAFWLKHVTSESWWKAQVNFARSMAVVAIIGHVIGLGDRHLDNLLVNLETGEVVNIDYNVCFEKGKLLRVPETVPFRLTQNIVHALGISGVEGEFRLSCENVLSLLREHKNTFVTLLETFVHDPLIDWRKTYGIGPNGLVVHSILSTIQGDVKLRKYVEQSRDLNKRFFLYRYEECKALWIENRNSFNEAFKMSSEMLDQMEITCNSIANTRQRCATYEAVLKLLSQATENSDHSLYKSLENNQDYIAAYGEVIESYAELMDNLKKYQELNVTYLNSISQLNNLHGFRQKVDNAFLKPPQCFIELAMEFLRATGQTQKIQPYKTLESKIVPSFTALPDLCNSLLNLLEAYKSAQMLLPAVDKKKHRLQVWLELLESVSKCSCESGALEANLQQTERLLDHWSPPGQQKRRVGQASAEQFYADACRTAKFFQTLLDNGEKMPIIRAGDLKKIFANTTDMGPVFIASSEAALVKWLASVAKELSWLEQNCRTANDEHGSNNAEQQGQGIFNFGWLDIYLTVLKYLQSVRQLLLLPAFEKFCQQTILQRLDAGQRLFQCCVSLVEHLCTSLVPTMYTVAVDNHAELSSWLSGVLDACTAASTLSMDSVWQMLVKRQLPVGVEEESDDFYSHHLLDQLQRINDELSVRKPIFSHRLGDQAMAVFRQCLDSFMAIKDHVKALLDCLLQGGGGSSPADNSPLPTVDYRWSTVLDFIYNYAMYRCASAALSYAEGDVPLCNGEHSFSVSAVFVDLPDAVGTMLWQKLLLNSLSSALLNSVLDSVNNFRRCSSNGMPISDAHPMVQQYQTDIRNFVQTVQFELTKDACGVLKNALAPLNGLVRSYAWHCESVLKRADVLLLPPALIEPTCSTVLIGLNEHLDQLRNIVNELKESCEELSTTAKDTISRLTWAAGANATWSSKLEEFEKAKESDLGQFDTAVELCDRFILITDSLLNYESLKSDSEQLVDLDDAMVESVKLYLKKLKKYMSIATGMEPAEIELAKLKPSDEEHVTEQWLLSILDDFEKRHSEANKELTRVQDEFFVKKINFHTVTEFVRLLLNEHRKFTAEARAYMKHLAFSGDEVEAKLANFFLHLQKLHTLAFSDVLRTDITSLPDTWDFSTWIEATKVAFKRAAYLTNTIFDVLIDFIDPEATSSHSRARVCRLNYLILKFTAGNQSKSPNLILDVKSRSGKLNALALNAWKCVRAKLEGRNSKSEIPLSIADQVDALISDATNLDNLALMYEGWTAWV